jgi:ATP-dependent Clp protease adaptor protein ClpS
MPGMQQETRLVPKRIEEAEGESQHEPLVRVIIHNDNVTPMDFVIHILRTIFLIPDPNSTAIMYTAHRTGRAYVQSLPRPEAERRIHKAHFAARLSQYPLEFSWESE